MTETKLAYGVYGLSYEYRKSGASRPALKEIQFEVEEGSFIALLGPNGSGKSTLLKMISGVLPFARQQVEGQVRCRGEDLLRLTPDGRACLITYVPADLLVDFPLTAFEAVLMGRSHAMGSIFDRGSEADFIRVEEAMRACQCWGFRERDLRELSSGERQLVAMARALAYGAKNLLIDESLSRMDLHHQAILGALLKRLCTEKRYSVVLVSHDWNLATEWADRCVLLREGQVVAQGPCEQVLTASRLEELFPAAPVYIGTHPETGKPRIYFHQR
jgi:iron complex transport system ATP-binding protein